MIEVSIDSIRVSAMNYQRVVILKDKAADRYLPIWIGPAEADAIAVKLQDISVPRPLTHDLLHSVLKAMGAEVSCIVVSELKNDTFFARIVMDVDSKHLEIDSRPSDAIALAVRTKVPIFVEDAVFEQAGIVLDKETGKATPAGQEKTGQVTEEELKRMSAFADFIKNLDMDDLDKGRS